MLRLTIVCVLSITLLRASLHAQISPGELSRAHAGLEGMGNCTSCHTLGKVVSNDGCLRCHAEIQARIAARSGLHALYEGRHCVECHKEHHGRNFPLVRFDVSSFNHSTVGFALQGVHLRVPCAQCHRRDNIKAEDVLKNGAALEAGTYLGLSSECTSCHADAHKGQFTGSCLRCHAMDGWKPAPRYDHNTARFPLTGLHRKIECGKCHRKDAANVIRFTGLQFGSCSSCHRDPHTGRFKESCGSCHTTTGWNQVATGHFDHASTRFPLRGRHSSLKCEQCHGGRKGASGNGIKIAQFARCADCHADAHAGQLVGRPDKGACESCHTVNGFSPSTFVTEQHQRTHFALSGGHLAIPCRSCHTAQPVTAKSPWKFRWDNARRCETCHSDLHRYQFGAAAPEGCPTCHITEGWRRVRYSHEHTRFPLQGKHRELPCAQCHIITGTVAEGRGIPVPDTARTHPDAPQRLLRWNGPVECATCHLDVHRGQFQQRFANRCQVCHTTLAWDALLFSHENTSFSLTGRHAQVACVTCHLLAGQGTPQERRVYIGTPVRCAGCHASTRETSGTAEGGGQ